MSEEKDMAQQQHVEAQHVEAPNAHSQFTTEKYINELNHNTKRRRVSNDDYLTTHITTMISNHNTNVTSIDLNNVSNEETIKQQKERLRIEGIVKSKLEILKDRTDVDGKVKRAKLLKRALIELHYKKSDETCAICIQDMKGHKVIHTPCGHTFHMNCLNTQISTYKNLKCSLCRHPIYDNDDDDDDDRYYRNAFNVTALAVAISSNHYLDALAEIANIEWSENNRYNAEQAQAQQTEGAQAQQTEQSQVEPMIGQAQPAQTAHAEEQPAQRAQTEEHTEGAQVEPMIGQAQHTEEHTEGAQTEQSEIEDMNILAFEISQLLERIDIELEFRNLEIRINNLLSGIEEKINEIDETLTNTGVGVGVCVGEASQESQASQASQESQASQASQASQESQESQESQASEASQATNEVGDDGAIADKPH